MSGGADLDQILDALLRPGLRNLPSFAVAHISASGPRVALRRAGRVSFSTEHGNQTLQAPPDSPWLEQELPAACADITLSADISTAGHPLPMAAGVTLAATISIRSSSTTAATTTPAPPDPLPDPTEPIDIAALEPEPDDDQRDDAEPVVPEPVHAEPVNVEPIPVAEPAVAEAAATDHGPVADLPAAVLAAVPDIVEPTPQPAAGSLDESYDDLFGATQRPIPIEQLAIADHEPPATAPSPLSGDTLAPPPELLVEIHAEPPPAPADGSPRPTGPAAAAGALIDSVPWAAGSGTPPPAPQPIHLAPAPAPHPTSAHVAPTSEAHADPGHTISRAALRAVEPTSPTVVAARCPNGHLTSIHAPHCRVCGAPVPEQDGQEVARPPLGILRFSTGESIALDRGIVIGRAPTPTGTTTNAHLLQLASPDNDLSRNHAEIVLDGWHVAVKDLGSTNGTTIALPGQQPVRLRKGDPHLLEPGAVIVLADVITCTYEVTS